MELAGVGLQPNVLTMNDHPKKSGRVGGATQVIALVDMPTGIAGHCGISRWAVMSDRGTSPVLPQVPVSLFEGPGAIVDLVQKVIRFEKRQDETTIARLHSGHYSMYLVKCPRTGWNLPSTVSTETRRDPFTRTPLQADVNLCRKELESRVLTLISPVKVNLTRRLLRRAERAKHSRAHHQVNRRRQASRCTDSIDLRRQRQKMT